MGSIETALEFAAERASPLARELFAESWTPAQVEAFVCARRNATVASTSSTGRPHAAVVIAAALDGEIYFSVTPGSVLARNIGADHRIALTVCDSVHAVMGQGRAVRVGCAPDLEPLLRRLAAVSPSGRFTPVGWAGDIYRVELRRLFAN